MKRNGTALVAAALSLSVTLLSAQTSNAQATTERESIVVPVAESPYQDTLVNPCNGDVITLSGNVRISSHSTYDSGANPNYVEHTQYSITYVNVTGVSESGENYRLVQNERYKENFNGTLESGFITSSVIVGQGATSDFIIHSITKFVTDPETGENKVFVDRLGATCSGGEFK